VSAGMAVQLRPCGAVRQSSADNDVNTAMNNLHFLEP
jgi:hypothetical protein